MKNPVLPTFVTAPDGVRLAVYEWGTPTGPELLLIHGNAQCHLCWAPQIDSGLAEEFRIVAVDLRGHGASDKPSTPESYQGPSVWAKDLAAVMAAKSLRRPLLVGWSMGGRIIRQYLMNFGDAAIAGINFVGSLVIEEPESRAPSGAGLHPRAGQPLYEQIAGAIAFLDRCYAIKPNETDFRVAIGYNLLVPFAVQDAVGGWKTDPADTIPALQQVTVPVLISHGRRDAVILPRAAERAATYMPHAELSWYETCGHSPFQEDAARFNTELAAFARRVFGPS
ncbi:MAG TPA: alpha/beta hydrolase [Rhodopila sp.]|uniref:alpha/beta fold hydrolase n=1 Tax=Rhodopila sp. TaxID=2480087 RepID=UPI002CA07CFC|nr:alpha/beta hydrolase [Rhodopila sp.]HVY16962.1 alpha/beta hydrolase [Rhodopila sp.]